MMATSHCFMNLYVASQVRTYVIICLIMSSYVFICFHIVHQNVIKNAQFDGCIFCTSHCPSLVFFVPSIRRCAEPGFWPLRHRFWKVRPGGCLLIWFLPRSLFVFSTCTYTSVNVCVYIIEICHYYVVVLIFPRRYQYSIPICVIMLDIIVCREIE